MLLFAKRQKLRLSKINPGAVDYGRPGIFLKSKGEKTLIFKSDIISSRANPAVKWVCGLQLKKIRDKEKSFFIEGEKLTYEALKTGLPLTRVYVCKSKSDKIIPILKEFEDDARYSSCQIFILEDSVFEKVSTENSPQGVISVLKYIDFFNKYDIIYKEDIVKIKNARALILHSIQDPGNLGAVIRSAVAFGVKNIFLSSDCVDVYNSKTVRGAMGTLFKVNISTVQNMDSLIKSLQENGRRVYAAELRDGAVSLTDIPLNCDDVFIIGNEGHGIPTDISSLCNGSVYIPISQDAESLNASVAASVIMWEQSKK